MRARFLPLAGAALAAAASAAAQPAPVVGREARTAMAVTVYNDDLALVKDTRELEVPSGEHEVRFADVAEKIEPRTVTVRSVTEPGKLTVVEQSWAFARLSPDELLRRYVGREVELVETDTRLRSRITRAVLLAVEGGPVYRIGDRVAVGHPGRVVLPELPAGLDPRPMLRWRVANTGDARHRVEVSYVTGGLGWTADYVLVLDRDGSRADVTAWVTLTNQSGARYDDATLKLVAGEVHRVRPRDRVAFAREAFAARAAAPKLEEEAFSEYHLYALDRPATLGEGETKQLRLLSADGVPVTTRYLLVGRPAFYRSPQGDLGRDVPVTVQLELRNDAASRLGVPLPAGTVRLYAEDASGARQLVGEDALRHTPKDETVRLRAGEAFDVVATRVQTEHREIDVKPYRAETAFRITIRNRKPAPVTVDVREPVGGEWTVVESSHPATRVDAGTIGFEVRVPAESEAVLIYRARVAY